MLSLCFSTVYCDRRLVPLSPWPRWPSLCLLTRLGISCSTPLPYQAPSLGHQASGVTLTPAAEFLPLSCPSLSSNNTVFLPCFLSLWGNSCLSLWLSSGCLHTSCLLLQPWPPPSIVFFLSSHFLISTVYGEYLYNYSKSEVAPSCHFSFPGPL